MEGQPFVISMSRSQVKKAKSWITLRNSVIDKKVMKIAPFFSRKYEIGTVIEKGKKGTYYNYSIKPLEIVSKEQFQMAYEIWKNLGRGMRQIKTVIEDGHVVAFDDPDNE